MKPFFYLNQQPSEAFKNSHKHGSLKYLKVVMNELLFGPTEGCASNLVLWMMEKKQACPDSVSLLSSSAAQ